MRITYSNSNKYSWIMIKRKLCFKICGSIFMVFEQVVWKPYFHLKSLKVQNVLARKKIEGKCPARNQANSFILMPRSAHFSNEEIIIEQKFRKRVASILRYDLSSIIACHLPQFQWLFLCFIGKDDDETLTNTLRLCCEKLYTNRDGSCRKKQTK